MNHQADMFNKHVSFSIERCKNGPNYNQCYPDDEIDEFLKDVTVDGWSLQDNLDFMSFGKSPTFKMM